MGRTTMRAVSPWRSAFRLDLFRPASVRGPVESRALRRLDSICTTFNDVDIVFLSFSIAFPIGFDHACLVSLAVWAGMSLKMGRWELCT